ncbi:MAG: acyltransferase family protein [Candidatus Bathyarchaeia archaeon]
MRERWYWLDWLRVLAMGTIFLFHSSAPFSYFPWNINNPTPSLGFTIFGLFLLGWAMPLFFVISGISAYFSLARRSASQFVKERFERLVIPFVFVGLLVVLSVNGYYDAVFHGNFTGDFIHFYLGPYFTKFFPFDTNFSLTYFADSNQGVYLWYLFWLFVFSIVTVHFFKWLMKEGNRNKLSRLYAVCNRRGGILLLAIPLIVVNVAAVPPFFVFPTVYGGWKLPAYFVFFITAYVMASNPQFEESIVKSRVPALLLGFITSFLAVGALLIAEADPSGMSSHYLSVSTLWALNGWCWVVAILGFGRKHLSFNHKFLETSNELVLPFYVLHQSVIVAIAFYVVSLDLIVIEKFLLIVLASFPIIVALLYPISKINLLRFLFGMRMKNRSS